MYSLAIKLWSSEFDKESDEYKMLDSVVYLCNDVANRDILYLSTVINHLVGDDSLDEVFRKHVPVVKGEPVSWDEPLVKLEQPDYHSDNDNQKYSYFGHQMDMDDDCKQEPKARVAKAKKKRKRDSDDSDDSDDANDKDFETKTTKKKKTSVSKQSSEPLICKNCGKTFHKLGPFARHLRECNPEQLVELPERTKSGRKIKISEAEMLSCSFCARKFTFRKALEKHEILHTTDPDSKKLLLSVKVGLRAKERPPGYVSRPKGHYQCAKCPVVFKTYEALERHEQAHLRSETMPAEVEDENSLKLMDVKVEAHAQTFIMIYFMQLILQDGADMKCNICDIVYNTYGMYQHHMKKYHHKGNKCEDCGKTFTMPNALKNHVINNHTQFPKRCEDCGQYCITVQDYRVHRADAHGESYNNHLGNESSVPCEICGKSFKTKYSLKSHVKLVHSQNSEVVKFPCDQCGKDFKSKNSLEYHRKIHTGDYPHRCDECGNGFMKARDMQDCKNAHAGIFKFRCGHCDYKTNKEQQYTRHLTTHSSEKPFICPLCQHRSANLGAIGGHIRKSHKLTLLKAEILAKRNRHGHAMTEEEIEEAKKKAELYDKVAESQMVREQTNANRTHHVNRPPGKNAPIAKTRPAQPGDDNSNDNDGGSSAYQLPARIMFPGYF